MPETRQQKELIKQIEAKRESRLLVYFTGDRQPCRATSLKFERLR